MHIRSCKDKAIYQELHKKMGFHFLQSWQWGEVKKPVWNIYRIILDDQIPVSILTRKIPLVNRQFGYIPKFLDQRILSDDILSQILSYAQNDLKLSHLHIEPNICDENKRQVFQRYKPALETRTLQPNYSNIIGLDRTYDEIFSDFSATYRRNIRKGYKLGLEHEIFESGDFAIDKFYSIMKQIICRTKYVMHGPKYFQRIWEMLSPDKMAKIYLTKKDQTILGSIFMIFDNLGAYEMYGGVTDAGKKMRAGYVLRDVTIQDAIKMGKTFYDQWGVAKFDKDGFDKNDELFNISLFKEGFGGENVKFLPQFTYIFSKFDYSLYKFVISSNNLRIRLLKLLRNK